MIGIPEIKLRAKRFIVRRILKRNLPISLIKWGEEPDVEIENLGYFIEDNNKERAIFCNINFDDLSPRYSDGHELDFGGCPGKGVALLFENLLKDYPYIAVTHFVVPAYETQQNTLLSRFKKNEYYNISSPLYLEWLEYYKGLAGVYNIEFAQHGYHHRQAENIFFSRHTEFAFKNGPESSEAIRKGLEILKQSGMMIYGFRQPGWDINSDLSICRVLKELGFLYVAGSSYDAGFNTGRTKLDNFRPVLINGIINFPQNILLDWPLQKIKQEVDRIASMFGFISIKGHFVNRGMPNAFSSENVHKLRQALDYMVGEYKSRISFVTIKDIAERLSKYPERRDGVMENNDES